MKGKQKQLNEYKRIVRRIVDSAGFPGIPVQGHTSRYDPDYVVRVPIWFYLLFTFQEGTKVKVSVHRKNKRNIDRELSTSLADPASIPALKQLVEEELKRLMTGYKSNT